MFVDVTIPWTYKGGILLYDVMLSLFNEENTIVDTNLTLDTYTVIFNMYILSTIFIFAQILPSVCLSVAARQETNSFVAEILALISFQGLFIIAVQHDILSYKRACVCLQFSLCYTCYCIWRSTTKNHKLLAGNSFVRSVNLLCMPLFPIVFSHALNCGMHLSPHIFFLSFAGELVGLFSVLWCTLLKCILKYFNLLSVCF